jgi:hypothetical protein
MPDLINLLQILGLTASGFLWLKHLFLAAIFLALEPSTLVWRSDPYPELMRRWQIPGSRLRTMLFTVSLTAPLQGSFWILEGHA